MEYEIEQEMERMNREKMQKKEAYNNRNEKADPYQDIKPLAIPKVKPKMLPPAGGKSIRQQSDENQFTLSGYSNSETKGNQKIFSNFETTSKVYGNSDHVKIGKDNRGGS